jgi:uncharacterized protein
MKKLAQFQKKWLVWGKRRKKEAKEADEIQRLYDLSIQNYGEVQEQALAQLREKYLKARAELSEDVDCLQRTLNWTVPLSIGSGILAFLALIIAVVRAILR